MVNIDARASDVKNERSDCMSEAFCEKDFLGTNYEIDMQRVFLDFLTTAKTVREALGDKGYLLDEYVSNLLEGFCEARNEAGETLCPGFDEGMTLNGICRAVMERRPVDDRESFDVAVKTYIEAHPLPYENTITKRNLYASMLRSVFGEVATAKQEKDAIQACSAMYDSLGVKKLYERICAIIGNNANMGRLNAAFREQFMRVSSRDMFLQGQALGLAHALTYRDVETNRYVVHLLIDGVLPFKKV